MTIHLGTPQLIFIALQALGLMLSAKDHGKPRGNESFWVSLLAFGITTSILIWGGFYK